MNLSVNFTLRLWAYIIFLGKTPLDEPILHLGSTSFEYTFISDETSQT